MQDLVAKTLTARNTTNSSSTDADNNAGEADATNNNTTISLYEELAAECTVLFPL
jgi:hypothetical protein